LHKFPPSWWGDVEVHHFPVTQLGCGARCRESCCWLSVEAGDSWCRQPFPIPLAVLLSGEQIMIKGVVGEHRCWTVASYSELTFQKLQREERRSSVQMNSQLVLCRWGLWTGL